MSVFAYYLKKNPDVLGITASGLCFFHCVATPLLMIAQTGARGMHDTLPIWWSWVDYFFLIISLIAVYRSNRISSKANIGKALWASWGILAFIILNESAVWIDLPEYIIYFPAMALIALHFYNQR